MLTIVTYQFSLGIFCFGVGFFWIQPSWLQSFISSLLFFPFPCVHSSLNRALLPRMHAQGVK